MNDYAAVNISKYAQVPLAVLGMPGYEKLIFEIMNLNGYKNLSGKEFIVETVGDLTKLEPHQLAECPGIKSEYVNALIKFKKELPAFLCNTIPKTAVVESPPQISLSPTQLNTPLAQLTFSAQHQKLLKRISAVAGNIVTVHDLINLDLDNFAELPGVGKLYIQNLMFLQKQLPVLLEAQANKFTSLNFHNLNEIDNILLEYIESYLCALSEIKIDIALSRWGFKRRHETLEDVAHRVNLSGERVRQLERSINADLPLYLTIPSKVLWAYIRTRMTEDLTVLLPDLAKCFATDKLFYTIIELCCQVEEGSISKIFFTRIPTKVINSLFCSHPSPVAQEIIIDELMSGYGYDKASAIHGIKQLEKRRIIEITEQGVYPKKLGRAEAVAQILSSHPEGLHWKDVIGILNKRKYTSKPLNEARQVPSHFNESKYVYLCGKGIYRNLQFLDLEMFDIPKIMQHLVAYFKQEQTTALQLHDYHYQTKGQPCETEYFTLRHLVRKHGEEYGLYFDGKSNVGSVSIEPDSKHFTQADAIFKMLDESKIAMTMREIAERLESKSSGHVCFCVSNLEKEGKVVRVDKISYTAAEKAFSGIDTKAVMKVIREIIDGQHAIVEADVFREAGNMELNLNYSKYIYAALVNAQLKESGWYRQTTLFSKNPIPYKNLLDMCKQLCNPELSNDWNAKALHRAAWLSDAVAASVIHQWRRHLKAQDHAWDWPE